MATILERMTRRMRNALTWGPDTEPFEFEWEERTHDYDTWEALYDNRIYGEDANGGQKSVILNELLGIQCSDEIDINGFYNPVESIVDCYQGVFNGKYGEQIRPAEKVAGKPVNERILDPLRQIWKWSNLATEKQNLCKMAATYGTVGLRVVAEDNVNPLKRRVWIKPEHPKVIVDFDEDSRGNVTDILLEHSVLTGDLGEERRYGKIRQRLTKDYFQEYTPRGTKSWEPFGPRIENALGVCPYVILRHRGEKEYGLPAFHGSIDIIHLINWIISMQHTGVTKSIYGKWFATGSGPQPTSSNINDLETMTYAIQRSKDDPAPTMQHLHANLDHQRVTDFWESLVAKLKEKQPELVLNDLKVRSGQSGESIAQLMKPAEHRIRLAQGNYEHGLIRADQIGLSWGVVYGMWDIGTGMGSAAVADEAYEKGLEDFEFVDRQVLPQTIYDDIARIDAETHKRKRDIEDAAASEGFTSTRERLRMVGKTEAQATKIMNERATQDVDVEETVETSTGSGEQ